MATVEESKLTAFDKEVSSSALFEVDCIKMVHAAESNGVEVYGVNIGMLRRLITDLEGKPDTDEMNLAFVAT